MLAFSTLLALLPAIALASPINLEGRDLGKRYTGVKIKSNRDGMCLHVTGRYGYFDGTPVSTIDCSVAATWDINLGKGSIILHDQPKFALDAGSNPSNNGKLKLWTSYPGLFQQTWFLTGDKRVAIYNGDQCLDQGEYSSPQTYQCTPGNTNQIWDIVQGDANPNPPDDGDSDPVDGGHRIHSRLDGRQCVTVMGGGASTGAQIQLTGCFGNGSPWALMQLWDLPQGRPGQPGFVKLHNFPTYCMTTSPGWPNAGGVHLEECVSGKPEQLWAWTSGEFQIGNANARQCLDIEKDSVGGGSRPYTWQKDLQTWSCGVGNPQQSFYVKYD